jgi:uncharacterized protein YecE (DUF72 family)
MSEDRLFHREVVAEKLRRLAAENIFIGTSSWRYPGWASLHARAIHHARQTLKAKFEATCIAEYAETCPTVGGDFSFYLFPEPKFWGKLFETAPPNLMLD